jgi:predicted esterase
MKSTLNGLRQFQSRRHLTTAFALVFWLQGVGSLQAEDSVSFRTYLENWRKAEEAFAAKDYKRALGHYQKVAEVFPFEPTSRFQMACCESRLERGDEAIALLTDAIRFGWEDVTRLEQSEDLKSLRMRPQFSQLLKEAAACRDESLIVHIGKRVDPASPAPFLVVLQGLGCFRADLPYWEPAADETGCVLVAPRAVNKLGPMMYGWHRLGAKDSSAAGYFDLAAAGKRVDEAIAEAKRRCKIDPNRVMLAGFSQGAGVALRLVGDHADRYCGALLVCGLHQPPGVAYWRAILEKHPMRVSVLAGKLDPLLPRSQRVVEELQAAKVPCRYEEFDKMGHEYPPNYTAKLREAIEFIMGADANKR